MSATKRRFAEVATPEDGPVFDTSPIKQTVRRVTSVDIDQCAAWIIPMIQQDFGDPGREMIYRWMRQWSTDNNYSFVCTDNAVGLAMLSFEPMSPIATVQEVFLYVRPGRQYKPEGLEIYKHFAAWMRMNNAGRFRFWDSPGAPMDDLRALFPDLQEQKMWYIDA